MKTYIKKENVVEIDKHIKDAFNSKIKENKLFALLKLVDKKGTPIEAEENESLNGVKILEYKKGFFIGFIKTTFKNGVFKLQTFSLTTNKNL
jgi:hypothetical protein